ncbi:hypothetical protein GCM10020254_74780 [Streptomyces goshikiensis]
MSIAAVNGPRSVVVAGDEDAALAVAEAFPDRKSKRLTVSHAFHSPHMDGMLEGFRQVVAGLSFEAPRIPVVSNLTGALVTDEMASAEFWVRHVREAVRFLDGIRVLEAAGVTAYVELGPDGVLSALAQDCLTDTTHTTFAPALRAGRPEAETLVTALARAHAHGVEVDWAAYFAGSGARRVDLPTYAFQRQRFWPSAALFAAGDPEAIGFGDAGHPLLSAAVALADSEGVLLAGRLSVETHPWLVDHTILGSALLPGTAFVELAIRAGDEVGCDVVEELTLEAPLVLPERGGVQLQLVVEAPHGARPSAVQRVLPSPRCPHRGVLDPARVRCAGCRRPAGGRARLRRPRRVAARRRRARRHRRAVHGPGAGRCLLRAAVPGAEGRLAARRRTVHRGGAPGGRARRRRPVRAAPGAPRTRVCTPSATETPPSRRPPVRCCPSPGPASPSTRRAPLRCACVSPRIPRVTPHTLALLVTDETGRPVAAVESLTLRPASADQVSAAGAGHLESLFRVEWAPAPVATAPTGLRWGVLGRDEIGLAGSTGAQVTEYADAAALGAALAAGEPAFDAVFVVPSAPVPGGRCRRLGSHGGE